MTIHLALPLASFYVRLVFLRIFVIVEKLLTVSDFMTFFAAEALAVYLDMPI